VATKRFIGNNSGMVVGVDTIGVSWKTLANGQRQAAEVPRTEATIAGDLVLLALGYLGPEDRLLDRWSVPRNSSSNILGDWCETRQTVFRTWQPCGFQGSRSVLLGLMHQLSSTLWFVCH